MYSGTSLPLVTIQWFHMELNKFHFVERDTLANSLAGVGSVDVLAKEMILKSNIILIDSALEKEMSIEPMVVHHHENPPLDLPFRLCWFEMTNSEPEFFNGKGVVERRVGAIIAYEAAFNLYCFMCYEVYPTRQISFLTTATEDTVRLRQYFEAKEWVRKACAVLNKESTEVGQDKILMQVTKTGRFSGNTKVRMANVPITIAVPRQAARRTYVGSNQLDFSHRFEVRGHWRKTTGSIGKNREGEYVVQGYTWVKAHVKGPEDKPVIKKTRIIKGEQTNDNTSKGNINT